MDKIETITFPKLRGKAREYGGWYAGKRKSVESVLQDYGVRAKS